MSCLLPQFKCQPNTFSIHFRTTITTASASSHYHHFVNSSQSNSSKTREHVIFRTQCILLATTPLSETSAVLSIEKLRLPSLETKVGSATKQSPWVYENFEATLASETLLNSEEAIISAASAEALTLAKAAVKLAKEAASFVNNTQSSPSSSRASTYSKGSLVVESEQASATGEFMGGDFRVEDVNPLKYADNEEVTSEELEFIEELVESVAVRSIRRSERKAKRLRAVKKAASGVVLVKAGSVGRKKRNALNNVDHSDPLHYIRATTSSSKLLSAKEELELSQGIQDLLKLERLQEELAERCGDRPTFAQWATAAGIDQRTLRKRINNGIYSKDKMIKSNIRLVISIAKNYQGAGMNLQDLVQEGCRGLVRGAEKFDASKGFKFSTYAHWWIKQSLRKSLSDQSRTIRLPFHMVEATYRVKEARKQLYRQNGTLPSDEEVAAMAGLSMKRLSAVLLIPKAPRSLEQKIGIDQNLKPSEVISDPGAETSEEVLMKQFMRDELEKVLNSLNPREKQIIQWRFGLGDGRMKTLQEIGEIMGVSRERIRQIELCAFRKLKNKKKTVKFAAIFDFIVPPPPNTTSLNNGFSLLIYTFSLSVSITL